MIPKYAPEEIWLIDETGSLDDDNSGDFSGVLWCQDNVEEGQSQVPYIRLDIAKKRGMK